MGSSSSSSSSALADDTSSSYDEFRDDLIYDSMERYNDVADDVARRSDFEDEADEVEHEGLTLTELGNNLQSDESGRRPSSARSES